MIMKVFFASIIPYMFEPDLIRDYKEAEKEDEYSPEPVRCANDANQLHPSA